MRMLKRIIIYFVSAMLFHGCVDAIEVDLPPLVEKIVVEGAIEEGSNPYVFLTKNTPYFEPIDTMTLMNMLLMDAIVSVSDGTDTVILEPMIDMWRFPYLYYGSKKMIGEAGKNYFLSVEANDEKVSSRTVIPESVLIDSMWFELENDKDSLGLIWFTFEDPDTLGNFYRVFSKTLGKDSIFLTMQFSTIEDKIINGAADNRVGVYRGTNDEIDDQEDMERWYFKIGERVVIKFCTMDNVHFDFWDSYQNDRSSLGNPFAAPTYVQSNIEGKGLGIWGGYGVYLDTFEVKIDSLILE